LLSLLEKASATVDAKIAGTRHTADFNAAPAGAAFSIGNTAQQHKRNPQ
jgi:hypothetical protein